MVCVRQTAWPVCSDSHRILHRFYVALQHLLFNKNVLNLKFVHRKELEREFSIVLSADIEPADFQLPARGCLSPTLLSIYIYTCMKCFTGGKQLKYRVPSSPQGLGGQQSNGWTGEGPSSPSPNCRKNKRSSNTASAVRAGRIEKSRNYCNVTRLGVAILESHGGNFFPTLPLFPIAPEPAEPWASARAALCESLLRLRSFKSRLGFPFLWEQKWVSGGKFLEAFQRRGLKQPEQMAEFHHCLQRAPTVCFSVSKVLLGSARQRLPKSSSPAAGHKAKLSFLNAYPRAF